MMSFKRNEKDLQVPLGAVWLMNSIAECKGKQELYTRQSPQILKALVDIALIESTAASMFLRRQSGELHHLSHSGAVDAGEWKKKDNDIIRKNPDGTVEVILNLVEGQRQKLLFRQSIINGANSLFLILKSYAPA